MNYKQAVSGFVLVVAVLTGCFSQREVAFLATATPSSSVQWTKNPLTANNRLIHYRGPNPYRSSPSFDIAYDPSVWEFIEKDGSGVEPKLIHRSIPKCTVWLSAGPVGDQPLSTTKIAGYEWTISRVQPNIVDYSTPLDDIFLIFGLILPDKYTENVKSPCQQSMEDVLQTFKVVSG
jgi:hypothetical protein